MSTIKDAKIIAQMLENNGVYEDDPPAYAIYAYIPTRMKEMEVYAIFWHLEHINMSTSPDVWVYKLLFYEGKVTNKGKEWLEDYRVKEKEERERVHVQH